MSIRTITLLASIASITLAIPAFAQEHVDEALGDHHAQQHQSHTGAAYDGAWEGDWTDKQTWQGEWTGTYRHGGQHARGEHHLIDSARGPLGASPDGRLGYTLAEREAWLADCRYLMADGTPYDKGQRDSGLIGGLLGAVVGGVAGNRIAGRGSRLGGTLIGAGVGGVAGAAIGSAVDSDAQDEFDRNELWAARYCDAYLRRYEMGGGSWGYRSHAHRAKVVSSTRSNGSHGHRPGNGEDCRVCNEIVTEEWIEEEIVTPRPSSAPQGKITPIG